MTKFENIQAKKPSGNSEFTGLNVRQKCIFSQVQIVSDRFLIDFDPQDPVSHQSSVSHLPNLGAKALGSIPTNIGGSVALNPPIQLVLPETPKPLPLPADRI